MGTSPLALYTISPKWAIVLAVCALAAAIDLKTRRIPNWLTGPVLLIGLLRGVWGGAEGLVDSILGCLVAGLPYVLMFIVAGAGAGDAKLMGAIGAWLGVHEGTVALVCVLLTGTVVGALWACARKRGLRVLTNMVAMGSVLLGACLGRQRWRDVPAMLPDTRNMQAMPYGIAIFAGMCFAAGGLWCELF